MTQLRLATAVSNALAASALLFAAPLLATDEIETRTETEARTDTEAANDAEAAKLGTVTVLGEIVYRDRADTTAPTLVYDLEYFQRFEPRTVGDMLKRVPSVAFLSDVLEYDGARLRGMDPGYTQVLINGKKVPGGEDDRSFFVDRIPAEVVERIEIVRSPSANRSGDAMAGAINIVLRDAYEFDGGYVRVGASHFDDGEVKPTFAAVYSGDLGGGRLLAGASHQGRYNPKQKLSLRFEEPGGDFTDREEQSDTRDGTDDSLNLSWVHAADDHRYALNGLYVKTDREETEHSLEYNDRSSTSTDNLLSATDQLEDIDQRNLALSGEFRHDMAGGRTGLDISYARFDSDITSTEEETGFDDEVFPPAWDGFEGTREITDLRDSEVALKLYHERQLGGAKMEFGLDYTDKDRRTDIATSEVEAEDEGDPLPPYADFDRMGSRIDERRLDPYLMFSGEQGAVEWEAGLRYETTRTDIESDEIDESHDDNNLLPSGHLRWNLSPETRLNFSLARTVRRPNFDQQLPLLLEGEFGDNDFIGNPMLSQEKAWGVDFGFEHSLGRQGVIGINVFYRDVQDLIELVNTGEPSDDAVGSFEDDVEEFLEENPGADENTPGYPEFDPDSFVFTADNVGDGYVYGAEFDLSMPLTALGLPHTGVFLNYSWLDSHVEDAIGERRFNDQARSVFNIGFMQDLPEIGLSFGASYRKQGDAFSRVLAEEVETSYGADLEAYIEKRFGEKLTLRLTGSNLLDADKDESFHKFDTLDDQIDRDYDEFELESEHAGPVYQLVLRYAF